MARNTVVMLQAALAEKEEMINQLTKQLEESETKLKQVTMHKNTVHTTGKRCPVCYKFNCTVDHKAGACPICHAPAGKPHATHCK